jgi:hypothetical protein
MLKQFLNTTSHDLLRNKALTTVAALPSREVRNLIHREAPILGRVYTALTSEQTQRANICQKISAMTNADLRNAAKDRLPKSVRSILAWLDR